jgi:hypothetical protein
MRERKRFKSNEKERKIERFEMNRSREEGGREFNGQRIQEFTLNDICRRKSRDERGGGGGGRRERE